jgi:hypothetical protein
MTERSDDAAQQTARRPLPPPPPAQKAAQKPAQQGGGAKKASPSPAAPGLGERVQNRLNDAVRDFRANRDASRDASVAAPSTRPAPAAASSSTKTGKQSAHQRRRQARRARLRLTRIDPWSVMKTAFLLSIAFGVVTVISVMVVWSVLGAAGVWDSINATIGNVLGSTSTFDVTDYASTSRVVGFTLLVSVIDVVLLTAIATLAAFIYNMAAALLGGIEVTLAEEDHR